MNKKIEKLDPAFMGTNAGSAGASLDEVVLKINEVIDVLNGEPELAESEDERIRKEIVGVIQKHYPNTPESYRWISWLEKQKEPTKEELYAEAGTTEKEYIANTMKMVRAMREKKQEQKPISSCDIVPYIDEKIAALQDMWREEKVAFDWDDMKDMIEDVARHFYQKEQKPVDNEKVEMTDFEQSVYDLCPVLGIEEAKDTASDLLKLAKETLLKTGKVVLASNYPEGCSFEDGFHLGYNEGFNAKLKEQKPAEWSEEDEDAITTAIRACRYMTENFENSTKQYEDAIERLKSLRPSWKPSEEQMSNNEMGG